jgi:hypothetical protein
MWLGEWVVVVVVLSIVAEESERGRRVRDGENGDSPLSASSSLAGY